jgi:hypothetical protein
MKFAQTFSSGLLYLMLAASIGAGILVGMSLEAPLTRAVASGVQSGFASLSFVIIIAALHISASIRDLIDVAEKGDN